MFNKAHYLYTAFFCEENIWHLLKKLSHHDLTFEKTWILVITNPARQVPLFNQHSAPVNQAIIWDYHVILLADLEGQYRIFDFDTRLPFVTSLRHYIHHTFIISDELPEELVAYIRKIPAESYLQRFHSDRSHMLNQIKSSEFPDWPIINARKSHTITLDRYLNIEQDLDDDSQVFKVSSLRKLEQWLINSC